jgi:hypothetical protein
MNLQDVQAILGGLGALGGLAGASALIGTFLQRKKLKADAANVLTDTALTLVEPLKARVNELEAQGLKDRHRMRELEDEVGKVQRALQQVYYAILDPAATIERLRDYVRDRVQ